MPLSLPSTNLSLSEDDIKIQEEDSLAATAITSASSSPSLTVPRTARDKFFKDLQHDVIKKKMVYRMLVM